MAQYIRKIVSGNKARFKDDELDVELDLVYVTDHVIIMGFPATGFEGFYRNRREEAKKFLDHRHKDRYWIFNFCPLTENSYDKKFFHGRVSRYPFPDHHAPPLAILPLAVREMRDWLAQSRDNVVVLHCKAGKGRSGTLACAYLLSLDVSPTPPKLQRSYTAKQWAKLRAEQWMDVVETEDMPVDERGPDPEARKATEESRAPLGEGGCISLESPGIAIPATTANVVIPKVKSLPDLSDPSIDPTTGTALEHVLALHSSRRMKPHSKPDAKPRQGVSIPSQRRFLLYWSVLLSNSGPPLFWSLGIPQNDLARRPKVKIHRITVRLRDPGGPKLTFIKAVNKLLDKTITNGTSTGYNQQGMGNVWASLSRYDDGFVAHIEEWEKRTRSRDGRMDRRREDPDAERECVGVTEIFKDGRWDNAKMVRGFARFGRADRNVDVQAVDATEGETVNPNSKSNIYTHVLLPLDHQKWTVVKENIKSETTAPTDVSSNIQSEDENMILEDAEQLSVSTEGPGMRISVSDSSGVIVDAGREVRIKLFLGQVFLGWIWFIPTFHMPQPPPTMSVETPFAKVHWLLTRKDVDFPVGFGAWIVDIDVEMSWAPSYENISKTKPTLSKSGPSEGPNKHSALSVPMES